MAVGVVTTSARMGYHLQQRADSAFDVGQMSAYTWEQFRVGGLTERLDEPYIDPCVDYDILVVDNLPWSEGGFEGGVPTGDEMEQFVRELLGQLRKQTGVENA